MDRDSVGCVGYVSTIEGFRNEIDNLEALLDSTPVDELLSDAIILANVNPDVLEDASTRELGHFRSILAASVQRVEAKAGKDRRWSLITALIGAALTFLTASLGTFSKDASPAVSNAITVLLVLGLVLAICSPLTMWRGSGWAAVSPHLQRALAVVDAERQRRKVSSPPPYRESERRRLVEGAPSTQTAVGAQDAEQDAEADSASEPEARKTAR